MQVDNKFEIGDHVVLFADPSKDLRIVTAFKVFKGGEILYDLTSVAGTTDHYDFEFTHQNGNKVSAGFKLGS